MINREISSKVSKFKNSIESAVNANYYQSHARQAPASILSLLFSFCSSARGFSIHGKGFENRQRRASKCITPIISACTRVPRYANAFRWRRGFYERRHFMPPPLHIMHSDFWNSRARKINSYLHVIHEGTF